MTTFTGPFSPVDCSMVATKLECIAPWLTAPLGSSPFFFPLPLILAAAFVAFVAFGAGDFPFVFDVETGASTVVTEVTEVVSVGAASPGSAFGFGPGLTLALMDRIGWKNVSVAAPIKPLFGASRSVAFLDLVGLSSSNLTGSLPSVTMVL